MSRLGLQHHSGRDSGLRVKWGNLRFLFRNRSEGIAQHDIPPPPDQCCNESPGEVLHEVVEDLNTLFDKWYGAANKTTSGYYDIWSGPCGTSRRVPTAAALDEAIGALCETEPLIHELFNALRDVIQMLPNLEFGNSRLRRKPRAPVTPVSLDTCDITTCVPLDKFSVTYTPTRRCDSPSACTNAVGIGSSPNTRVVPGHKLCAYHYIELKTIVDDIMANGVVEFDATVRSTAPCGAVVEGMVCEQRNLIVYDEGQSGAECCTAGELTGCYCCLGPEASITGYYEETVWSTFDDTTNIHCRDTNSQCWSGNGDNCFPDPLRDNTPYEDDACLYEKYTVTQVSAVSRVDPSSCTFEIQANIYYETLSNPHGLPCRQLFFTSSPITVYLSYGDLGNGRCGWRSFPSLRDILSECGTFGENQPSDGCDGVITSYVDDCCTANDRKVHEWWYRRFVLNADASTCDANCDASNCPCPGPVLSDTTDYVEVDVRLAFPRAFKFRTARCDPGSTNLSVSLRFEIKYGESCPDSGLTNITMLDSRLGAVSSSYLTKTIAAPVLSNPDCPGGISKTCSPVCLIGYGELA